MTLASVALLSAACGGDSPSRPDDREAPGTVTDLFARPESDSVVVLTWTAPGDDGRTGRAASYEVRYSPEDPTLMDWWETLADPVPAPPAPAPAGAPEELRIHGLTPGITYAFRLRAFDEAGNGSFLSNVARVEVEPPRPPAVDDLAAATVTSSWVVLGWTAPFGAVSAPVAYELRRSLSPIETEEAWDAADEVPGLPEPSPPGAAESFRMEDLEASRSYSLLLRTRSASGILSRIGSSLSIDTPHIRLIRGATPIEFPNLRAAIEAAADGEVIELGGGRFTGPDNRGLIVEDKSITLRGAAGTESECILDLEEGGRALVFRGSEGNGDQGSIVQWVSFVNGRAAAGGFFGGAVLCSGTGPAFASCRFRNNHADTSGGAVALTGGSSARFEGCLFEENDATNDGGAVWADAGSSPRFTRSSFLGNRAENRGGAVAVRPGGAPIFEDRCVFKDNRAGRDGGALAYEGAGGEIRDTVFLTNAAGTVGNAGGGAVFCYRASSPLFDQCHFEENDAAKWGGAIYAWIDSAPRFANSIFVGNTAEEGGAALSFNRSIPQFDRCTLVANSAEAGGGLRAIGAASGFILARSILAFSPRGSSVDCQNDAGVDVQCSLIFGNAPRNWNAPCIADQESEPGNLGVDPLFCFPEIEDYRLRADSPAAETASCGTLGAREIGCAP